MNTILHKNAVAGKWFTLSAAEQMGNIGSEVERAEKWQGKDAQSFQSATDRALELFDLTLADPRWRRQARLREIALARELFCDAVAGGKEYGASLKDMDNYFLPFALAARKDV
ncbi:MAG: hypothetical protein A3J30_02235 [Candidatus Wildermuthbacteria bacterium RIFCSPLOWO2_02_FULL_47_9c]|uniref:Uncharacterized protein n=2 Tax=Parcubacteria group TaxID=1794811 RepID=A0A837INY8_9BACT|nr:MAG: hypothetical protein UY25_C0002G0011 [Candidatus Yanofskybacteria bacterium GW2011_GWC1_48_11]KKW04740.1 MAG: hypothetical protein UY38_C0001G0307 [Parcubacteria group bacterium GW2011_GWB1_49_12]KKW08959.1 MAG: hypothetical protein UY45_C0002G0011 [Parcubacteria group bacterium GW2011_GWA1_49_26]KKW14272.1 MAG: hypothetical protein UY53_C0002G0061 [Parcubacteria group bacterium GW2011_GWA2_50_10]OHA61014.1 MAG: hypothetical protein A2109_02050 [Candidatus Wildermuthbacteria bacterium G